MNILAYMKALFCAPRHRMRAADGLAAYVLFIINMIFGMEYSLNGFSLIISFLCSFMYIAGIYTADSYNRRPNIASLMPLSKKQNIAYRFISTILLFLLITVVVALVFIAIALLSIIIFVLPNGGGFDMDGAGDAVEIVGAQVGVYGGLFSAAYFVMMYSTGIISGFFKRRKYRNIYLICVCGAVLLSFILIGIPYSRNPLLSVSIFDRNRVSPFVNVCFEAMKLPQLCIAIWYAIAAASLACAVYLSLRQYKKSSAV